MAKYRKKPVVIDAFCWDGSVEAVQAFERLAPKACHNSIVDHAGRLAFETKEGLMTFPLGYMIIRGVEGEMYGCDPAIFAKTYELAGEEHA